VVVVASVGLSFPFPAGCAAHDVTVTGLDEQAPPAQLTDEQVLFLSDIFPAGSRS
jgi:hypothetical protein